MKLSKTQLSGLLTNAKEQDGNLYANCPKCGHNEFGISLEDNHLFGCFRAKKCGFSGNIFTLLKFLGKDLSTYSKKKEANVLVDKFNMIEEIKKELFELPPTTTPPVFWTRKYSDEYCESRHIKPYQFQKYKIGRSKLKKEYVTILIEMDGKTRGYLSRSIKTKEWHDQYPHILRWNNSKTDFKKMLGGFDEIIKGKTKTVILVEGFFDKTRTEDHLQLDNIDEIKCCFTFGGHVSDDQVKLLQMKGVENIILLFEPDILNKIISTSQKIGSKFASLKIGYLPLQKDPNELEAEELFEVLDNVEDFVSFQLKYS